MYIVISQMYWPIWLIFLAFGYPIVGAIVTSILIFAALRLAWWFEFKE